MRDAERTLALPRGKLYYHPDRVSEPSPALFDPAYWQRQGGLEPTPAGRGASWFIHTTGDRHWVLRAYRRGGWIARISAANYVFTGESRTRPSREWRILTYLEKQGLPAPRPVAAHYERRGLVYRAAILTERLTGAHPLSRILGERDLPPHVWQAIGRSIRAFHDAGVCHADLNAHNILLDDSNQVFLIDFDKARIRKPGRWWQANLARLARSLDKLRGADPGFCYTGAEWAELLRGYRST